MCIRDRIIGELLDAGLPVFTELNLVDDGYDELTAKAKEKGLPLFLSSTMLYLSLIHIYHGFTGPAPRQAAENAAGLADDASFLCVRGGVRGIFVPELLYRHRGVRHCRKLSKRQVFAFDRFS